MSRNAPAAAGALLRPSRAAHRACGNISSEASLGFDVHMMDLQQGRFDLTGMAGLAAAGAASFGDVLGAGVGWAQPILCGPGMPGGLVEEVVGRVASTSKVTGGLVAKGTAPAARCASARTPINWSAQTGSALMSRIGVPGPGPRPLDHPGPPKRDSSA